MKAPFPIDPVLTSIALGYGNERMIADDVLPRIPVARQEFKYNVYSLADAFTVPNTEVGRKSKPNEVEFAASEKTGATRDHGLEEPIPYADIENAAGRFDPLGRGTALLTDLIMLDREKRVADLVMATGSYAAGNQTDLTGSGKKQWSDPASTPIEDITGAMDNMVMRPSILVLSRGVMTKLSMHPDIVMAWHANEGGTGIVPRQFLASLFELDDVLVGEGWINTAKPGKTPTMVRVWGKNAALLVRNHPVSNVGGVTFGYTVQWGDRIAGRWDDRDIGLRGGVRVRVGESVAELVVANDLGYLFEKAIA